MTDNCILPADHPIGASFRRAVPEKKVILVAGLPSSGKSLMLQQLTILAGQAGRAVHIMQWDVARRAFETEAWLTRYPEVDNVTHPGIRKAVGIWVRSAVADWMRRHAQDRDILIGELPVVGGRFAELLHPVDDDAEPLLASDAVQFFVPIPTDPMREVITGYRAATFANPRNEQETKDAPIHIVQNDWLAARRLHNRWTGQPDDPDQDTRYSTRIYSEVFQRLLRFRNHEILSVDRSFETSGSAYDRSGPVAELTASHDGVAAAFAALEAAFPGDAAQRATDNWADF